MVNCQTKQPPPFIPPEYTLSATKFVGAFGIFFLIISGLMAFSDSHEWYPTLVLQVVPWMLAGSVVGAILGALITRNQLSWLSKEYQYSSNKKEVALVLIPMFLFFIFVFLTSVNIYGLSIVVSMQVSYVSVYVLGIPFLTTRVIMLRTFEKRENMRLMQAWFGDKIFLGPKPPVEQKS
jgi:hypothetical protein